jgi:hypothetical protein
VRLQVQGDLTAAAVEAAALADNESVRQALTTCDERYFANDEPIAERLFAFLQVNRSLIRLVNGPNDR